MIAIVLLHNGLKELSMSLSNVRSYLLLLSLIWDYSVWPISAWWVLWSSNREELYVSNIDELLQIDRLGYTKVCCATSDVLASFDLLQCLRWCLKPLELVYQLRQLEHCLFSFVLMVRAKNVFVDQVNVLLDTIFCLIYAINLFVGEVVLSQGSNLWAWLLGPKQWCLLIQFLNGRKLKIWNP